MADIHVRILMVLGMGDMVGKVVEVEVLEDTVYMNPVYLVDR